jgi:D-tyrosyl-tRNA(Tyr) deacylase
MRVVVQRVASASVKTTDGVIGEIGPGLLALLGVARDDTSADCAWLARKLVRLRIFPGHPEGVEGGRGEPMSRSVTDCAGAILVVSQFTLHGSVRKGTRPSFNDAAPPEIAEPLYEEFILQLQTALGRPVQTGKFGALMRVTLVNDGPVTLIIDTKERT